MSNLMNKIGINDKNGTPIRLGDKLRVISDDFEGQLILNEKGIVCFDEIKNQFYIQKKKGSILLSEKFKDNYSIITKIKVGCFYKHKRCEKLAIEVVKIEDFISRQKIWFEGYDFEGICEPRNWIFSKRKTDENFTEIDESEYVKLIDRFKIKKCICK